MLKICHICVSHNRVLGIVAKNVPNNLPNHILRTIDMNILNNLRIPELQIVMKIS